MGLPEISDTIQRLGSRRLPWSQSLNKQAVEPLIPVHAIDQNSSWTGVPGLSSREFAM